MQPTCDWHIHTHHSCDCPQPEGATLAKVCAQIEAAGITHYGISDHLHTAFNVPEIEASRAEFDTLPPSPNRYFGVEVSMLREYDIVSNAIADTPTPWGKWPAGPEGPLAVYLPDELIERMRFDYVIGGAHWPLGVPEPLDPMAVIRDYHRQNMFLAAHPRVDIVAHPWWWMGAWEDANGSYTTYPWLDDFTRIPLSMHDEFAAALKQYNKAVEINAGACLVNPGYPSTFRGQYLDYLAYLKAQGVRFSLGTDSHGWYDPGIGYSPCLGEVAAELEALGLTDEGLWYPQTCRKKRNQ